MKLIASLTLIAAASLTSAQPASAATGPEQVYAYSTGNCRTAPSNIVVRSDGNTCYRARILKAQGKVMYVWVSGTTWRPCNGSDLYYAQCK
jgi:hypothetical protein